MELPGRCGDWLYTDTDTDTDTDQGFKLRLDTTSKGWGLVLGHHRGGRIPPKRCNTWVGEPATSSARNTKACSIACT